MKGELFAIYVATPNKPFGFLKYLHGRYYFGPNPYYVALFDKENAIHNLEKFRAESPDCFKFGILPEHTAALIQSINLN